MPYICAFGCKTTDVVMHYFPNPKKYPERFKLWVNLVGENLKTLSDDDIHAKKRICDIHFTDDHRVRNKRLSALAVPSLHLPSTSKMQLSDTATDTQPSSSIPVKPGEPKTADLENVHTHPVYAQPSTSASGDRHCISSSANLLEDHNYSVISKPRPKRSVKGELKTADLENVHTYPVYAQPSTSASGDRHCISSSANLLVDHNYSVISRPRPKRSVKGASGTYLCGLNTASSLKKKIRHLQTEINRLRKRGQSFKERLANATDLSENGAFKAVLQQMTKPAQIFMNMQLQARKKPKGRRFSIEEKILSLSLFKKSPKAYGHFYKYFTLPSSKAMKRLLNQIKLTPGINNIIFKKIKNTLDSKEVPDRLCSLIFDEMSINPQIFYAAHKDQLEGFTSSNSKNVFADHVLVFMVKGVKNNFKQPIAYYFTNGLTKLDLKNILSTVLEHCFKNKLIALNTVCDQSPVNVGAITEMVNETKTLYMRLGKEWRHEVIQIKGHSVVPLYDVPHIMKGIRNNLMTKDLIYMQNNERKTVKWDYYHNMVYDADKAKGELRLLNKLTEEHINKEKINKMRVKLATQLFSHSVAVTTDHLVARGDLPMECRQIVDFTLLLDNLFDTLNVSNLSIPNGKVYKGPIKRNSPHHSLWKDAKSLLKTVKYVKKVKVGDKIRLVETVVPSVTNLIKTIEGMETIWKVLSRKYGFDLMLTRNFNQDPLENFFGNIRSYGARNIAPNTVGFEGAFKALLLNNYSSPHSRGANCEEDLSECLQNLDFFLKEKNETPNVSKNSEIIHFDDKICFAQTHESDAGQSNYVCGWVLKKCYSNIIKGCTICKSSLADETSNVNNYYIKAKEYQNKKWLCYPSKEIENHFNDIKNIAISILKKNVPKNGVKSSMLSFTDMLLENPFKCARHKNDLNNYFKNTTLNVLIYSWCRNVNRILSGKWKYDGDDDDTKIAAHRYYTKHKNYKNRK